MPHLNRMTCMGHLGRDPELKQFSNGGAVCKTTIALKGKPRKGSDGKWGNDTTWLDVQLFDKGERGKQATNFAQYAKKGDAVYLEGMLSQENWTDSSGQKRSKMVLDAEDFQLLGQRGQGQQQQETRQDQAPAASSSGDVPW
ncbi:MAG TPA: single-stranded DNA-binding protein [Gemmatales bacterium]|nr:single-stranded DNA-binding protein [Gemmatales bacterium]